ncbi:MAG: hypothetical protein QXO70_02970 [Candidatus Pacearchaeota archaeon]
MDNALKVALEIANTIREENLRGKDRIPTSETLIKKLVQTYDVDPDSIFQLLNKLQEAHYIFIFQVVQADPSLFVQAVEAYVYADQSVLSELKFYCENKLAQTYEGTFYKKKSAINIVRELISKLKEYNNTPLGRALNEYRMVEEFGRIVASSAFDYTDSWRKEKLIKLLKEGDEFKDFEIEIESSAKEEIPTINTSYRNENFSFQKQPLQGSKWQRAVSQFSVKFLLRIHFRKYEFDVVRKLIMTGKITELEDFIFIRDSIKKIETLVDKDPILKYHVDKLRDLRRLAQAKINIIRKNQNGTKSSAA